MLLTAPEGILRYLVIQILKPVTLILLVAFSFSATAQQRDSVKTGTTHITGLITDSTGGKALSLINVTFDGSAYGTTSDKSGHFSLGATGSYTHVTFSGVGYLPVTKGILPGQNNQLRIKLNRSQTQLKEVAIKGAKIKPYRNKGNPAVELIQQVINHKTQNRMESADYLQYNQYERIALSLFDLPRKFTEGAFFSKYKFMLDSTSQINGENHVTLPVFVTEKISQEYYRKNPEKNIHILEAEKGINIIKFIDTVGLDIYLNRMYGDNIDIYNNNIFIITNQFLSPIADHAPDFYKFFIADTIQLGNQKVVELNFTPRAKGDLLFEGKLQVTLDGRYSVVGCELNVNKQINLNFMRSLHINLDFKQDSSMRYILSKSDVKADFGVRRDKGMAVYGERTVNYTNYKLNKPLAPVFYEGKSQQIAKNADQPDTAYWNKNRPDTLSKDDSAIFSRVTRLENMKSFKRTTWIIGTLAGGYANVGPVQIGNIGSFFTYNGQEGIRLQLGGRTTPQFNKNIYLQGYAAYGTRDGVYKYNTNVYYSLNQVAPWRYPSNYFKLSYLSDVNLPGQSVAINTGQAALASFYTGKTNYWLYNKIFSIAYVKDFENHVTFDVAFKNWNQLPAGTLLFQSNDPSGNLAHNLTVNQIEVGLRYAPHEQIILGTEMRHTIYSKYPIFNLLVDHAFTGIFNGSYNYTSISANIGKRLYMSQLGFGDITLLGNLITGKVPFPLLNISPANQSLAYDPTAYNQMYYLEFVSDHYAGINYTQSFNGFFFNKIPLIYHLKWREYLSFKVLYGGVRNENNPLYSNGLYQFPKAVDGANGTYALGNTPYVEAGAGIGNIFKIFRFDIIRRFNYLDHPDVSPYGIKFSLNIDL